MQVALTQRTRWWMVVGAMLAMSGSAFAQATKKPKATPIPIADLKRAEPVDFEKEVLPILSKSCLACHSQSEAEAGVILESPQTILKGKTAEEKPIVVAGKSGESPLLAVAAHSVEPIMPPAGNDRNAPKLTSEQLGLLKLWIDQGAKGEVTGTRGPVAWQPLPAGVNPIYSVAISPDGQYAACGRANQVFLYHVPTGRLLTRLTDPDAVKALGGDKAGVAHLDLVQSMQFSPQGDLLATGGFRTVKLWRKPANAKGINLAGAAGDAVRAVAVSADRKWLATAGVDKTIRLFSLADGAAGKTLAGHADAVNGLAFLPDGKLASASADKTVRVWDVNEGKQVGQIFAADALLAIAAVQAEEPLLAFGGNDKIVYVYKIPTDIPAAAPTEKSPLEVKQLAGSGGPVTSLASYGTGATASVIGGSQDGSARVWTVANGQVAKTLAHGAPITGVAAKADGSALATASDNKTVRLWNGTNNQQIAEMKGDQRAHVALANATTMANRANAYLTDQKTLFANAEKDVPTKEKASKDAAEKLAKDEKTYQEKAEPLKKLAEEKAAIEKELAMLEKAAAEAKEKATKAKAEADGAKDDKAKQDASAAAEKASTEAADKSKAAAKKLADQMKPFTDAEKAAKDAEGLFNNSKRTAEQTAGDLKKAQELVPTLKKVVDEAEAAKKTRDEAVAKATTASTESEKPFRAVAFSPDGLLLAAAGDDNLVHTYDAATGKEADLVTGHSGPVLALAFTGDTALAAGSADKSAAVWDLAADWKLERTIGKPDDAMTLVDRVLTMSFSPDGALLATGGGEPSRNGELKVWNVADGKLAKEFPDAHSDAIFDLEFSADGKFIASCGADKFVKTFDMASGKFIRAYEGHTNHVMGVSWRSNNKMLASCGADNVVKVWNVDTGDQLRTIQGFTKQITAIQFVGDTDEFVTSCGDKQVRRHNAASGGNVRAYAGGTDFMYAVASTPDGAVVVSGGHDSVLYVWNGTSGTVLRSFAPPQPPAAANAAAQAGASK